MNDISVSSWRHFQDDTKTFILNVCVIFFTCLCITNPLLTHNSFMKTCEIIFDK